MLIVLAIIAIVLIDCFFGSPVRRFIMDHLPSGNMHPAGRISRGEVGVVGHRKLKLESPQLSPPLFGPDRNLGGIINR